MSDFYGVRYRGGGGSGFRDTTGEYTGGGGGRSRPGNVGAPAAGRPRRNMYDGLSKQLKRDLKKAGEAARRAQREHHFAQQMFKVFNPMRRTKLMLKLIEYTIDRDIPGPLDLFSPHQEEKEGHKEYLDFNQTNCHGVCEYPVPAPGGMRYAFYRDLGPCDGEIDQRWVCDPGQLPHGTLEEFPTFTMNGPYGDGYRLYIGPSNGLPGALERFNVTEVWGWKREMDTPPVTIIPTFYPEVEPQPEKQPTYVPAPSPFPYFLPDGLPILQPAPDPVRFPYRVIPYIPRTNPWPQGRVNLEPSTDTWVDPRTPGSTDPGAEPGVETDGGQMVPTGPHQNLPPGRTEKERKRSYSPGQEMLKRLADGLGGTMAEGADYVDAVYDALDKKCRGARTPQAKLQCIWKNFDHLNMKKAVENLVWNEVEDRFFGALGKINKKASRRLFPNQRGRGIMTGGAGQRYHGPYLKL